jgi:hypothetical protein
LDQNGIYLNIIQNQNSISIFEPFAGSAGYSLNHSNKQVVLYDNNDNIWALWEWLINYASYNPCAISEIPVNIKEGTDIRILGLSTGQELLLKHWQRTNNFGNCWTISPWGNKPGQWTVNTRVRVSEEVECIRHWKLANQSLEYTQNNITYFIDPPYQYNYQYGCKYFDWKWLGESIKKIPLPHQIICCEARCPKTGKIPDWAPFVDFRKSVTSRRKSTQNHHSKEMIYLNEETGIPT